MVSSAPASDGLPPVTICEMPQPGSDRENQVLLAVPCCLSMMVATVIQIEIAMVN